MSGEEVNENVQAALRAVIESRKRRARDMEAREELEQRISQMKSDQFRTEAEHRRVLEVAQAAHARAVVQAIASATVSAESKQREQPRVMLSAAIEEFARFKLAKKEWRGKTEEKMRAALELFLRAVGDQPLSHIGQPKVVEFLELLRRLPPNLQKLRALEGKTLHEIAALSLPPISEKTVADRLDAVIAFFRWCVQRGDCRLERSPADGLALGSPKSTERLPFSDQQLLRLLSSEEFQQRRFPNWYSFWLIPMALFTGARLGELCQLELANFVYVDDVCCIEIMDAGEEQTLKNRNSKRLVPLHDKLIEMGLMRHVEAAKREGKVRLFPELDLNVSASHVASKLFGRYRARCGVTGVEAPFHSFRHTFITRIMDAGGNLSQLAPIVGHGEKLITGNTYWNKRDARARREVVRLLAVPEEIATLLPAVEQVTVAKSSN
ncbi:phage-related integrase [Caballeronia cordobensis]|uniref:Phage-related integrase n=1 Tax=Caballeronia cordobensis TaxID=1353886 RepID=A0A158F4H0_CABCO|nr:site-specific integrase [Caballeronia cordobensis]SAL14249.1 phage-related integrase [Caballeronia cordobensis]